MLKPGDLVRYEPPEPGEFARSRTGQGLQQRTLRVDKFGAGNHLVYVKPLVFDDWWQETFDGREWVAFGLRALKKV